MAFGTTPVHEGGSPRLKRMSREQVTKTIMHGLLASTLIVFHRLRRSSMYSRTYPTRCRTFSVN